ncbi:MAG: nucleotide pyrophosphohydrolase [Tetrasphaera sp.]
MPIAHPTLAAFQDEVRAFARERGWGQFHDPKSVLLALVGEVGELAELFQWLPADEARQRAAAEPLHTRVGEELADVLIYLATLANTLDIDLLTVARAKLDHGRRRFPVDDVTGTAPIKD